MKRILRNRGLVVVFALLASVSLASAASITQTQLFGGTPSLQQTMTFDEFDDMGGSLILLSVFVSMDLDVAGGFMVLDNDGEFGASGMYDFGADALLSSSDVSLLNTALLPVLTKLEALTSGAFTLAANDGDALGDFSAIGPDSLIVTGLSQTDADSGFLADLVEPQFIGTSTFDLVVDATQRSDFGGVGGIEWAVTPVTANGSVTVVYNYVPEPATMSLLAVGGVAALIRRRRK